MCNHGSGKGMAQNFIDCRARQLFAFIYVTYRILAISHTTESHFAVTPISDAGIRTISSLLIYFSANEIFVPQSRMETTLNKGSQLYSALSQRILEYLAMNDEC